MSQYLDTRDLYKRKCELEELRDAVTAAQDEYDEAKTALDAHRATIRPEEGAAEEIWGINDTDLEDTLHDARDALEAAQDAFTEDEQTELSELEDLENEMDARAFKDGETLIPETDFEDYARQLAEDIGAIPDDAGWPCTCIDWEQAARELAMDYTSVTYQGTDYLVRA
jgi:hypothetical protein